MKTVMMLAMVAVAGIFLTTGCASSGHHGSHAMKCDGSCCSDHATCMKCCTDAAGCAKCCHK